LELIIIINIFIWHHKVITSEALGPGGMLLARGKRDKTIGDILMMG